MFNRVDSSFNLSFLGNTPLSSFYELYIENGNPLVKYHI